MTANWLTDAALRRARPQDKPYRLSDGQDIYLLIRISQALLQFSHHCALNAKT
jgi:hypothetical protein